MKTSAMEAIREYSLFKGVPDPTLEKISARALRRTLSKGECLFSPGDEADGMYAIMSGRLRIWTVSASGLEITLNMMSAGTLLGEIGLLDGGERTAGVSAAVKSEVMLIERRAFFDAMDKDPTLTRNVIELLCSRLRWVSARLEDSALRSAPERLARLLEYLSVDHGEETKDGVVISVNLSQTELARWTMMSRESLNKILSRWATEGLLVHDRATFTVMDRERLNEIAEFGEQP